MKARKTHIMMLLAGGAIGALLVGTSIAVTSSSFRYSETKTGFLSFAPADFAPDSSGNVYKNFATEGYEDTTSLCANAGVHLPQGARAKSVTFYFEGNGPAASFGALFRRKAKALSSPEYPPFSSMIPTASVGTNEPSAVTRQVRDAKQLIDNKQFEYGIYVCPNDGVFHGARIKYTYTTAGD